MEINLGFSTGCLHKSGLTLRKQLELIAQTGCTLVELNFLRAEDLVANRNTDVRGNELRPFQYVSLHAPVYAYGRDKGTFDIFAAIRKINRIRGLDLVVVHPDTVRDFSAFDNLDFPVAFENMDKRKKRDKIPSDLLKIMDSSEEYRMVLDVNHAFTHDIDDADCRLAAAFWQKLHPWIDQVHLSGYAPPEHNHWPLFKTKQGFIIRSIENLEVPIIVESVLTPDELAQEKDYILRVLEEPPGRPP